MSLSMWSVHRASVGISRPGKLHVEEGAEALHLDRRDSVLGLVVSRGLRNGASCIVSSSTKSSSGSTTGLFPRAISSRRCEYPSPPRFRPLRML
ncbi:unnamed protein product [Microthlaspi erraticum]|uniref:Uncharacterized protein n=1 Tax=Microthlaspi erraticum TaxID=1685480 RepID=A0A6D2IBQ9_9BRAS|nr:unnamed protein product [Microthlaspi erraticum]